MQCDRKGKDFISNTFTWQEPHFTSAKPCPLSAETLEMTMCLSQHLYSSVFQNYRQFYCVFIFPSWERTPERFPHSAGFGRSPLCPKVKVKPIMLITFFAPSGLSHRINVILKKMDLKSYLHIKILFPLPQSLCLKNILGSLLIIQLFSLLLILVPPPSPAPR